MVIKPKQQERKNKKHKLVLSHSCEPTLNHCSINGTCCW